MYSSLKFLAAALAVGQVAAQTHSDCNPLDKTCPADPGSTESTLDFDFTKSVDASQWTTTAGHVTTGPDGAVFTLAKKGDAPTIQSKFNIFYGDIEIVMKAAPGTGIVSSLVFESDTLDEIDWEALGGNTGAIETNYFGKGDTSSYDRATYPAVTTPQDVYHTYKVSWQEQTTTWSIDGNVVRTLNYADAKGGSRYPQTPMTIRIGIWAGGDPSNGEGTIEWAGGPTDYSQAPFNMYVKSVKINNKNPAKSYTYSDHSGSSGSIKLSDATAPNLSQSDSSSTSTATSTSSGDSASSTTGSSTVHTTLATTTTTASSSDSTTTAGSTTTDSSSSSTSGSSSSSDAASSSGSGSGASSTGSGSGSGSGSSSSSGSGSGSASASGSAASPSSTYNAASTMAVSYATPISLLALLGAFIQL